MDNQIAVYTGVDKAEIRVLVQNDTVWLTQAQICQLLGRERSVITKHIGNALKEGEIDAESNVQILHIANSDKPVRFYDLDVVISVGYRVKSLQGTLFRRWATRVLREMLLKRLGDLKRIDSLEQRMGSVEDGMEQLREGVEYLAQQLEGDTELPHQRVGFGAKEGEVVDKPYGRLATGDLRQATGDLRQATGDLRGGRLATGDLRLAGVGKTATCDGRLATFGDGACRSSVVASRKR